MSNSVFSLRSIRRFTAIRFQHLAQFKQLRGERCQSLAAFIIKNFDGRDFLKIFDVLNLRFFVIFDNRSGSARLPAV